MICKSMETADNLLASPQRLGPDDSRWDGLHCATSRVVVFRSKSTVQELTVFRSSEEGLFVGHPNASDDMILNETTKRVTRSRHKILVVSVGNKSSFCLCNRRLREMHVHLCISTLALF